MSLPWWIPVPWMYSASQPGGPFAATPATSQNQGTSQSQTNSNNWGGGTNWSNTSGWSQTDRDMRNQHWDSQMPFLTPEWQGLGDTFRATLENRLTNPFGVPEGYEQGGLRQINRSYRAAGDALQGRMADRGRQLTTEDIGLEGERAGAAADFLSQLPMVERQIRNEDLGMAQAGMGMFGRGQFGQGESNTQEQAITNFLQKMVGGNQWWNQGQSNTTGQTSSTGSDMPYQPSLWDQILPLMMQMLGAGMGG